MCLNYLYSNHSFNFSLCSICMHKLIQLILFIHHFLHMCFPEFCSILFIKLKRSILSHAPFSYDVNTFIRFRNIHPNSLILSLFIIALATTFLSAFFNFLCIFMLLSSSLLHTRFFPSHLIACFAAHNHVLKLCFLFFLYPHSFLKSSRTSLKIRIDHDCCLTSYIFTQHSKCCP